MNFKYIYKISSIKYVFGRAYPIKCADNFISYSSGNKWNFNKSYKFLYSIWEKPHTINEVWRLRIENMSKVFRGEKYHIGDIPMSRNYKKLTVSSIYHFQILLNRKDDSKHGQIETIKYIVLKIWNIISKIKG